MYRVIVIEDASILEGYDKISAWTEEAGLEWYVNLYDTSDPDQNVSVKNVVVEIKDQVMVIAHEDGQFVLVNAPSTFFITPEWKEHERFHIKD